MYQMMEDWGKEGSCYGDGTVEETDGMGWAYVIFVTLLVFLGGAFTGAIIASTSTVSIVKEKYCMQYTNTQEYIACTHKPIQEIYTLMEKR